MEQEVWTLVKALPQLTIIKYNHVFNHSSNLLKDNIISTSPSNLALDVSPMGREEIKK